MGKFYSKEEIEFLKENAEKFGADICVQKLNRYTKRRDREFKIYINF